MTTPITRIGNITAAAELTNRMVPTTQPSFVAEPDRPNPCVDNTERCKEQEEVDIKGS